MSAFRMISKRHSVWRTSAFVSAGLFCLTFVGAGKSAITKLTLDPSAPVVDVFKGMETGQVDVRMSMVNENEGRIFFTNKTDRPLTVVIPKAIVGIHVLPQFQQQPGGFFQNMLGNQGGNGLNGGNNGMGMGLGMGQAVGGNAMPGGQNGFPNANGFPNQNGQNNAIPGGNFFSIPPEKAVQINLRSVCLNHGRPEPDVGMTYRMVKVESITTDPVLLQLLEDYSPRTNQSAQQAAAWHLANGLSWEQLANLPAQPGIPVPMFDATQLEAAKNMVAQAKTKAAERPKKEVAPVATASAR